MAVSEFEYALFIRDAVNAILPTVLEFSVAGYVCDPLRLALSSNSYTMRAGHSLDNTHVLCLTYIQTSFL